MKIWIDLANSPQVIFFIPIIQELRNRGHTVTLTARDFSQTVGLTQKYNLEAKVMGHRDQGAHGKIRKALHLTGRVTDMIKFARAEKFDLAVSHNSYAQVAAARLLGIPAVTLMDYEHQPANHICFRLARRVIVPEAFPDENLKRFGVSKGKARRYHGIKEQVYLSSFQPDPDFLSKAAFDPERILITIRPPGDTSMYHQFENHLFKDLLYYLHRFEKTTLLILPRTPEQRHGLASLDMPKLIFPAEVLDGPNLIYHSDLVISGGGTMNREAAMLGTPAYSVFAGKACAVDAWLAQQKRLIFIRNQDDFKNITITKKPAGYHPMANKELLNQVTDLIMELI